MTSDLRRTADAFDRRASGYAKSGWHKRCAERLVRLCGLAPGQHVLDAATGTGFAALAAAKIVGADGHVTGVDISPGMLAEARLAADQASLANIDFVQADVVRLPQYASHRFDVVVCAAGLLYLPAEEALREWHRLLKPAGLVAFSTMRAGSPEAGRIFRECAARFGVVLRDPSEALGSADASQRVLEDTGFEATRIVGEIVEFTPQDLEAAWESNVNSAAHEAVWQLGAAELQMLRTQYEDALEHETRKGTSSMTHAGLFYVMGRRR